MFSSIASVRSTRLAIAVAGLVLAALGWAGAASAQGVCTNPYVCPAPDSASFPNTGTAFFNPITMTYVAPTTTNTVVIPASNTYVAPATTAVVMPANTTYVAPGATYVAPLQMASTSPEPSITVGSSASYSLGGNYCTLADGGQVWVPAGADPASMGC